MNEALMEHFKKNPNVRMGMPAASGPEKMQELETEIEKLKVSVEFFSSVISELNERLTKLEKTPAQKPRQTKAKVEDK